MTVALLLPLAATGVVSFAVVMGPFILCIRAGLRPFMSARAIKRWQIPVATGLGLGAVGATAANGVLLGPMASVTTAVLILLILMAVLDLAWRWLPFEWTLPLLGLGLLTALAQGTTPSAIGGLLLGGGTLLGLQLFFHYARGLQALGTGDIWLAAGLGTLSGVSQIPLILALAAVTGLLVAGIAKLMMRNAPGNRYGVAYGTHLCLAYFISLPF